MRNSAALKTLLAAAGCQKAPQVVKLTPAVIESVPKQMAGRDLRKDPSRVEAMDLELLAEPQTSANTRLTVRISATERVPAQLQTTLEDRVMTLRDDGQEGDEKAGCHAGEAQTFFKHGKPAPFGSAAGLSGFLTGINVNDPADGMPVRAFSDLARRKADLEQLAGGSCFLQVSIVPLRLAH
jgi:hypothetical protein